MDYTVLYYEFQSKLATNKKWTAAEAEAMYIELMEQCRGRMQAEEQVAELKKQIEELKGGKV